MGGLIITLAAVATAAEARASTTFEATYTISIGTVVIGRATAQSSFSDDAYTAAISGSTGGLSRLASDASAQLSGSGRISGTTVLPSSFDLETVERGFGTYVHMEMTSGRVTKLIAAPSLAAAADRIPLTDRHKTGVVDPLAAFLVPFDRPGVPSGRAACDRTIKVFDGWTRFDIQLYYKATKAVDGGSETYAGRIIVCGARYIQVAGHRSQADSQNDLVGNERLEVWLAPVGETRLLVPFRIQVGTRWGDLIVHATRFVTEAEEDRASLN
ncbi:MAG: DUF3108 domain-containing protein [Hyphomicrobiales bacterium]|nr:DUF3108 domain-containing protein [Hyphomicrobiales bacterium]